MSINKRQALLFVAVALLAGAAGVLFSISRYGGTAAGASQAVMATRLADLQGQSQALSQWRGKVLIVNFWATWCAPCREEIPVFIRLQEKYRTQGLQFVGIAIDQRDPVEVFAREFGMNYPVLLGGIETVEMSRQAGNRAGALPFTLILDRDGKIIGTELGSIKETKLEGIIKPLL